MDLFVSACYVNIAQETALKSARLVRERKRKASDLTESMRRNISLTTLEQNKRAGELRERIAAARTCMTPGGCSANHNTAVAPVMHAEQAQQHKLLPTERLMRIPPQGFVLTISRGMLVGRLREMIAAKMGVEPFAVELKLVSQHTLSMPRSRMSSFPIENWSQEQVVETARSACAGVSAFFGFCKNDFLQSPSTNHPTIRAQERSEAKALRAGCLPEGSSASSKKNERARAGYAHSDSNPAAPLWKCKAAESSPAANGNQGTRRIPLLQEWKPSCPSAPCRGQSAGDRASPSRPGKHGDDSCPERPTSAGKETGAQVYSPGSARKEHATNSGKHGIDVDRNVTGSGTNAANASSADETAGSAGVDSHRLSLRTSVSCSSNDSGENAHSRDAPDDTSMASLMRLKVAPGLKSSSKDKTSPKDRLMRTTEEDVSASLSILSEETANSDQISAALAHGSQQVRFFP